MKAFYILISLLFSAAASAQIYGCTDSQSLNFNPHATQNDGSCIYQPLTLSMASSKVLPPVIGETSGLIYHNGNLLTHNDSNDSNLYEIDPGNAAITSTFSLPVFNNDWEEISQDDDHIYVGDFGNNVSGNRTNLRIYKIDKQSIMAGTPVVDTIRFSYANQTALTAVPANTTNYDCEAFIVKGDHIYLFSKEWSSQTTSVYKLPKIGGTFTAQFLASYPSNGMITGATYNQQKNILALAGYNNMMSPFMLLLYDFESDNFFSGNLRRINLSMPFHQIEAITSADGLNYFLTNERLVQLPFLNIPAKLHSVSISDLIAFPALGTNEAALKEKTIVFYDNVSSTLNIDFAGQISGVNYVIMNQSGQVICDGTLSEKITKVTVNGLSAGIYFVRFNKGNGAVIKFIVR